MLEKQDLQQIETIMDKKFDDFAVIVKQGFDQTHQRIDEVNQSLGSRIDEVNLNLSTQIDETNQHIEDVNRNLSSRLDETNQHIDETNQRIDRLYTAVDGFIALYQKVDQEVVMLRSRIERLEETVQRLQMQSAGAR